MEYRKRFDLNQNICQWKGTLSQNGALSPDNILELESHLLDELDMLKTQGLTEEESFLVAQKRIGNVDALTSEYGKVNKGRRFLVRLKPYIIGVLIYVAFLSVTQVMHNLVLMGCHTIPEFSNTGYNYVSIIVLSAFIVTSVLFLLIKLKFNSTFINRLIKIPVLLVIVLICKPADIFVRIISSRILFETNTKVLTTTSINYAVFNLVVLTLILIISLILLIQLRKPKRLAIQN